MGKIKDAYFNSGEARKVGGQAIMEGVMMRGANVCSMAVRKEDNSIELLDIPIKPEGERIFILKAPIVRGVVSFGGSLVLGMRALMKSAEIAGEGIEEEPTRFERYLIAKFGEKKIMQALIYFAVVVAIALSVGLFMVLPVAVGGLFSNILGIAEEGGDTSALSIIEGFTRILIFLVYILLISKMRDIQRVFQYHGAEHKAINCYESGSDLTVENVRSYSRIHKRCGTSFLFIVMIISMIVFLFVRTDDFGMRVLSRILLVPVIAGISYEFLKFAGKSRSRILYVLSAPGLALQIATTKEPSDDQIETAIMALKRATGEEEKEARDITAGNAP